MPLDRIKVIQVATGLVGRKYLFGGKWKLDTMNPPDSGIDCSGFTKYCYWRSGSTLPDGCVAQFYATKPTEDPQPGDLGFFFKSDGSGVVDHTGLFDVSEVIEARGDPYNAVIRRPAAKWEAYKFFSGWRTLK